MSLRKNIFLYSFIVTSCEVDLIDECCQICDPDEKKPVSIGAK